MKKIKNILKKFNRKILEYIVTNRLFLSYVIIALLGTFLLRINTIGHANKIFPLFTDLGMILLLGSFGYFIKGKNQFNYYFTIICIFTLIEVINSIYYAFYGSFASIGELATLSQTGTVAGSIFEKMKIKFIIYIIFPIIYYAIHKKLLMSIYYNFISKIENGKKMWRYTFLAAVLFIASGFITATKSDFSRIVKQWNRVAIVERFGIILYQGNDIFQTLRPKLSSLFGYDDALNLFKEFYSSPDYDSYREPNKYTNILKGKNLVFVHMESMQDFLMDLSFNDEEVTPNLNQLAKEGMFFSNFYPQVSSGTSSDTEFSILTSLIPSAPGTIFVSYYDRNYQTLTKLLNNNDYYTFSMHGNLSTMWNRNKVHPAFGYQGMYFEEYFEYTEDDVINLGINDKLFFKQAIPILETVEKNHKQYMGTIITLSNHSPFKFLDKYGQYDMSTTYSEEDEETGEIIKHKTDYLADTAVGNYLQSVHYADSALGDFLEYIKNSDAFNDTIFIFYGDHDAKLSRKEINYLYNYNYQDGEIYQEGDKEYVNYDTFDHELNKKTPLIIWTKNPELKYVFRGEVDYYMGMIDLNPTLLNMLGLKMDYVLGHDIFNIRDNNVIVFPNGNFLSNMMYYNNSIGEYKVINKNTIINADYIENNKKYVENLLDVSNAIIVYDVLKEQVNLNE